jgi:hypothetical protein
MKNESVGTRLIALKDQSGLSLSTIARAAGYKNASSIQRYFSVDYDAEYLPIPIAKRIAQALVGAGKPPINHLDIELLTEHGFPGARLAHVDVRRAAMPVIYCSPTLLAVPPEEAKLPDIEYMLASEEDPVRAFVKPPHLLHRHINALYLSTTTMAPRHRVGDVIYYELERPVAVGQDAIVSLYLPTEALFLFIGRLVELTRTHAEFELLEPYQRVRIARGDVESMAPILSAADLLEPAPIR